MYYGFYGPYPALLAVSIILSMYASYKVNSSYRKYSRIYNKTGINGAAAARRILDANGLHNIIIEISPGVMTDHYDPSSGTIRLSQDVYNGSTLASVSIAAHEVGHAIQHKERYGLLVLRNTVAVPVNIAGNLSWILIVIGVILTGTASASTGNMLINLGIIFFAAVVLFHLVTLPVELNASRRALVQMENLGIIFRDEAYGARKMLRAAAFTYLAALIVSLIQLIRLIAMRRD